MSDALEPATAMPALGAPPAATGSPQARPEHCERKELCEDVARYRRRLKWVIFPDNPWIARWDALLLFLLLALAFYLPFQVGVSGGYYLVVSDGWFITQTAINGVFCVDTFLYFFRAHYDRRGLMIVDRRRIAKGYLRGMFIPNLISCFPSTVVFVALAHHAIEHGQRSGTGINPGVTAIIHLIEYFKFLRLARVGAIASSSDLVIRVKEAWPSQVLRLIWFLFLLVLVSHLFACLWCFVAFAQAGSLGQDLLASRNWISNWVNNTESDINPIGWDNSLDRYVLGLFWATQTLTSIGYGNIMPFTAVEWWISSMLMLLAGLMWAYVIGSTCTIASALESRNEEHRARMDAATAMIKSFNFTPGDLDTRGRRFGRASGGLGRHASSLSSATAAKMSATARELLKGSLSKPPGPSSSSSASRANAPPESDWDHLAADSAASAARWAALPDRIRGYLRTRHKRGMRGADAPDRPALETFNILEQLPPELRRASALALFHGFLNSVPYLSSRFLSIDQQAEVASRCELMSFSSGERLFLRRGADRGLYIIRLGSALLLRSFAEHPPGLYVRLNLSTVLSVGSCYGAGECLLDADCPSLPETSVLAFLTFAEVLFVPRATVLAALERAPEAWRESACWNKLRALLANRQLGQLGQLGVV